MGKSSYHLGLQGEDLAAEYLSQQGYKILVRNFHSQQGEVDIIAQDGEFLVFVEVKNYSYRSYGSPVWAVRKNKRLSIIHAAETYLYKNGIKNTYCRFDVITIYRRRDGSRAIDLFKNAFMIN